MVSNRLLTYLNHKGKKQVLFLKTKLKLLVSYLISKAYVFLKKQHTLISASETDKERDKQKDKNDNKNLIVLTKQQENKKEIPESGITSEVISLAESLEDCIKNVEPKFLEVGAELQTLYSNARELAQLTVEIARTIGGDSEESLLNSIGNLARQSLKELKHCRNQITDSLKQVDTSSEYLEKLCNICPAIEKTGMSLNVVGLNIAVESSRASESSEMFTVFVKEIRQLAIRVLDIAKNIFNDSETTYSEQIVAHDRILKNLADFGKLQNIAEKTVQNTVHEIRKVMKISVKLLEDSGLHLQEISRQVGEIVVAIQFHDITRQQIEHIVLALQDAVYLCNEGKSDNSDTDDANIPAAMGCAYKVLNLQTGQLKEVISEIDAAYEKSILAFEILGDLVDKLVAQTSHLDTSDYKEESETGTRIATLKSDLQELRKLLDQGHGLKNEIGKTADQVSDAASRLSCHIDQVRSISMELHLKALNAIVKSARLTESGMTFEILAQEVNRLSQQSNLIVTDVVEILESIHSLSHDLKLETKDSLPEPEDIGAESEETVSPDRHLPAIIQKSEIRQSSGFQLSSFDESIREISNSYDTFRENSVSVLQRAQQLQSAIIKTKSELQFLSELKNDLTTYLYRLGEIVESLTPWAEKENDAPVDKMNQIVNRYTMKRERDLHGKYIAHTEETDASVHDVEVEFFPELMLTEPENHKHEGQTAESSKETSTASEDDDLGDNVELF